MRTDDAARRAAFALVQLTRHTNDRYRDVDDATRELSRSIG